MNRDEYHQLLAERSALQRIRDGIPTENVLDLASVEARLCRVNERIAAATPDERSPARARITFRGRPVIGSHGIFAEFGVAATKAFTDAVAMMAASLSSPLSSTGPIPNRDQNKLLITSTAVGSFGFELEEHRERHLLFDDESNVALAFAQAQQLLEGTAGTDDELTEAAAGIDPRVITAIENFLETLVTNEAVCAVEYGNRRFAFRDVGQVRRGKERLARDNLHEDEQTYVGEFQGVLPKRRTFEFKVSDEDTVLSGKIGSSISDLDALNRHLHRRAKITLVVTRIGNSRPRYVLNSQPMWLSEDADGIGH